MVWLALRTDILRFMRSPPNPTAKFWSAASSALSTEPPRLQSSALEPRLDHRFLLRSGAWGPTYSIRALLVQPDGKILIAGNFLAVNGIARGRVARLNANGTLDTSFDPGTGADGTIYALAQDSAGNVFVGGAFDTFNGVFRLGLAKLSPTGALDSAFNQAGGGYVVRAITPPDGAGRIVIGGSFTSYGGQLARRIARMDGTTGAIDVRIHPGLLAMASIVRSRRFCLHPTENTMLEDCLAGSIGANRSRVARLNSDGSLDTTFVGPTINSIVSALALQNGKLFVGRNLHESDQQDFAFDEQRRLGLDLRHGTGIDTSPANTYWICS